jgi:hypothetical protein
MKTIIKETIAETEGIETTAEKTRIAIGSFSQEAQENTTSHQMTCSVSHATCITHTSTTREYHGMQ